MALSEQEKLFATEYVRLGCGIGDAVQAAINAGYAESTARYASQWINERNQHKPTAKYKPELHEYIKSLQDIKLDDSIMGIKEIQIWWSEMMRNPEQDPKDRIKCSELLAKAQGAFVLKIDADVQTETTINIELVDDDEC